jgi:hypothetical protein
MRRIAALAALFGVALGSGPARAWDPSTTHAELVERAVTTSPMHVRWMEGSDLQRGVFTALRVDPRRLPDAMRRRITLALRHAHAESGAAGLGGPGACPGASAPPATRTLCVDGDRWELSALGWMQLGVVAEVEPRDRLLHHFVDRDHPQADTWKDPRLGQVASSVEHLRAGATVSELLAGTTFEGTGPSALAWLADDTDPLAPPATMAELRRATLGATPAERDEAMALGLMGLGALLHVLQDLAVPAHARGDVTAFFAPLSRTPGDRGLPLQELVRVEYGRGRLPSALSLAPRATTGSLLAPTLRSHVLGYGEFEGLAAIAGHRFLSEQSVPEPRVLPPRLDAEAAAAALLAGTGLSEVETTGAKLSPWPSDSGYVLSGAGRPLAAFEVDEVGQVRLYLERRIFRDQAGHLLPLAIDVSRSALDLLVPAFPPSKRDGSDVVVDLANLDRYADPKLVVLSEDAAGTRTVVARVRLKAGTRSRAPKALPAPPKGGRIVLAFLATSDGLPVTAEQVVGETFGEPRRAPAASPSPTRPGRVPPGDPTKPRPTPTPEDAPPATPEDAPPATPEDAPPATSEDAPPATPEDAAPATPEDTPPATPRKVPEGVAPKAPPAETPPTGSRPAIPVKPQQ